MALTHSAEANRRSAQCVRSFTSRQFKELHNSLVVIVTGNTFGVLDNADLFPRLVPGWQDKYADNWNKDYESSQKSQTEVWSFTDAHSGNLYIHADHPGRALRAFNPHWGSALGRTIHLARTSMPNFA
jgi:hypothetical protein